MQRLIIYSIMYESDGLHISDTNTDYELLPQIVSDNFEGKDLIQLANSHNIDIIGDVIKVEKKYYHQSLCVNYAIRIDCNVDNRYLGLINIPELSIPILATIDNEMTEEQATEIAHNQQAGIHDIGEDVDGNQILIKESWSYYHIIPLNGYSLTKFLEVLGISDDEHFYDDTSQCSNCNKWDDNDNCYESYHRIVNNCEQLGVRCGCWKEYCKDNLDNFINESFECIELDVAHELLKEGKLEHIARYIGGMTDGRGGYFAGESCEEGDPKEVLDKLLETNPDGQYVFTHDESGQFQVYFSVWKVLQN